MKNKGKKSERAQASGSLRVVWWFAGLIALAVVAYVAYGSLNKATAPSKAVPAQLEGRWLRPDGGYVLQLSEPGPEGRLKAAYFNPRAIHVSRAEWKREKNRLGVFVELRDMNYPGSTYTLIYEPASDQLKGVYFQAAMRQQFEVFFERLK